MPSSRRMSQRDQSFWTMELLFKGSDLVVVGVPDGRPG
jgi:hypothetical protein